MADKKQSSRFRFPWRKSGPRVEPEPRPTAKPQSPAQPTATVLTERPPFRSSGKAPVKASPSRAPPRTEPPPPSPSRATTQSPKTSATTQIKVESIPPSPSLVASKPQEATQVPSQTQSQPTTQQSSQLPSFSTEPPSPASQPEPNTKMTSKKTVSNAQNNTPTETTFQTPATSAGDAETISSAKKLDPDAIGGDHKHLSESEREPKEHKEGEKVVQVLTKEENTTGAPMQDRVIQLHTAGTDSGNDTKDPLGVGSQAEQRHKKQETFDIKETLATPSTNREPIKTVSSTNPKDRNTSSLSMEKLVSSTGEQAPPPPKEIREEIMKPDKLGTGHSMLERPVSVATLTGENRGASMQLSSEPAKKEESVHIHRSYKTNPDDSPEATTDEEESDEGEGIQMSREEEEEEGKAYINSNVQSINNSIVFNSSVTDRSPGVEAVFSESKSNGKSDPLQTHKAQFTTTPAEKLTHKSTVRRRCLRGLFMESSDSDSDNPEKPRRHGCRYNCGEKRKDSEISIL